MALIMYSACQNFPRAMEDRACKAYNQARPITSSALVDATSNCSTAVPNTSLKVGARAPKSSAAFLSCAGHHMLGYLCSKK